MVTEQKPGESGLDHAQNLHQVTQPNPSLSFHTSATIAPCTITHHFINSMLFVHIYELGHHNNPITLYNLFLIPDFKIIPVSSATFSAKHFNYHYFFPVYKWTTTQYVTWFCLILDPLSKMNYWGNSSRGQTWQNVPISCNGPAVYLLV